MDRGSEEQEVSSDGQKSRAGRHGPSFQEGRAPLGATCPRDTVASAPHGVHPQVQTTPQAHLCQHPGAVIHSRKYSRSPDAQIVDGNGCHFPMSLPIVASIF